MNKQTEEKINEFVAWAIPVGVLVYAVYEFTQNKSWLGVIGIGLGCGALGFMIRRYFE
jgi:hypothetical protein